MSEELARELDMDQKELLNMFPALDNKIRYNMALFFLENGKSINNKVAEAVKLTREDYRSHFSKLQEGNVVKLVGYEEDFMKCHAELTEKGRKVIEYFAKEEN